MKLCCNMLILKETLGKKMEIWGTQKKHKHCFWSLCVYFLFFFLSICLYFCCFPDTIKRNKSRLNRRLNPGLKSAFFLTVFQCSADFPSFSFKISILQQSFLCFVFLFLFFSESFVESLFSSCLYVVYFLFFWCVFYFQLFFVVLFLKKFLFFELALLWAS